MCYTIKRMKKAFVLMGVTVIMTLLLASSVLAVFYFKMQPGFTVQAFSCPPLSGFTFDYAFPKEQKPIINNPETAGGTCVVSFDNGKEMKITRLFYGGIPGEMEAPASLSLTNNNHVSYARKEDGLEFWTGDSVIKIEFAGFTGEDRIFRYVLTRKIIETFSSTFLEFK